MSISPKGTDRKKEKKGKKKRRGKGNKTAKKLVLWITLIAILVNSSNINKVCCPFFFFLTPTEQNEPSLSYNGSRHLDHLSKKATVLRSFSLFIVDWYESTLVAF